MGHIHQSWCNASYPCHDPHPRCTVCGYRTFHTGKCHHSWHEYDCPARISPFATCLLNAPKPKSFSITVPELLDALDNLVPEKVAENALLALKIVAHVRQHR